MFLSILFLLAVNCGVDILQAKANKTGNSSRTKERTLTIHSVKQLFTKHKNACFEGAVDAQIGPQAYHQPPHRQGHGAVATAS